MSDRELLTECLEALTHDAAQRTFAGGVRMSQLAIKLRAHLAAPSEDIEALRRENERLQNLLYDQMGEMFALRAAEQMRKQIAELKHAENERLREALKKYGRHLDDCALTLGGYQCTCGFNQQEVPR
jgi:hypothetical protein